VDHLAYLCRVQRFEVERGVLGDLPDYRLQSSHVQDARIARGRHSMSVVSLHGGDYQVYCSVFIELICIRVSQCLFCNVVIGEIELVRSLAGSHYTFLALAFVSSHRSFLSCPSLASSSERGHPK
jgi:hypothetical protein